MLKRKIERELAQFKAVKPKSAILLSGARQVGKTFIVREFAKGSYRCFLEIANFVKFGLKRLINLDTIHIIHHNKESYAHEQ
jgi:predicted AAA+ superfamily ATPase